MKSNPFLEPDLRRMQRFVDNREGKQRNRKVWNLQKVRWCVVDTIRIYLKKKVAGVNLGWKKLTMKHLNFLSWFSIPNQPLTQLLFIFYINGWAFSCSLLLTQITGEGGCSRGYWDRSRWNRRFISLLHHPVLFHQWPKISPWSSLYKAISHSEPIHILLNKSTYI